MTDTRAALPPLTVGISGQHETLDVIEASVRRLAAEFPDGFLLTDIVAIVSQSHADLTGQVPAAALPELVERLARTRLLDGTCRGRSAGVSA